MVPHATDVVQNWLKEVAKISVDGTGLSPDVCLVEACRVKSLLYNFRQLNDAVFRWGELWVTLSL